MHAMHEERSAAADAIEAARQMIDRLKVLHADAPRGHEHRTLHRSSVTGLSTAALSEESGSERSNCGGKTESPLYHREDSSEISGPSYLLSRCIHFISRWFPRYWLIADILFVRRGSTITVFFLKEASKRSHGWLSSRKQLEKLCLRCFTTTQA
jgi:hypothetical protein